MRDFLHTETREGAAVKLLRYRCDGCGNEETVANRHDIDDWWHAAISWLGDDRETENGRRTHWSFDNGPGDVPKHLNFCKVECAVSYFSGKASA